jgi:acyl dehydratase
LPTREDQPLTYRLSGDRNPLHSGPWFAKAMVGFPKPIMRGLCTIGSPAERWWPELGDSDASAITSIAARFSCRVLTSQ